MPSKKGEVMEYLDIYDEYMNKIGSESRDVVHQKGLWHKTVHCWMYDIDGNVYFQIRADSGKFYTTASGHVLAGETVRDAFKREIKEEIGIDTDVSNAIALDIVFWRQDKPQKNWFDRAFSHIYMNELPLTFKDFHFQQDEVAGLIRVNAKDCLDLLMDKKTSINATKITANNSVVVRITKSDFLTAPNEITAVKYGFILQSIIQKTIGIQNIYNKGSGDDYTTKIWSIQKLRDNYKADKNINDYYYESKPGAWIFTDTEQRNIDNTEIWRECKSLDNVYASNFGRISLGSNKNDKICKLYDKLNADEPICPKVFRELCKKHASNVGYLIAKNHAGEELGYVHRLVADAWFPDYNLNLSGVEVHHITNDGYDNCPENLILLSKEQHNQIRPSDKKSDPDYAPRKIKSVALN